MVNMLKQFLNYDFLKTVLDSISNQEFNYKQVLLPYKDKLKNSEGSIHKVITKGKAVKIENRTIYPVIMFSTIEFEDKFTYESITPFALAVIEADSKYFIPFDKENKIIQDLLSEDGLWKELGLE